MATSKKPDPNQAAAKAVRKVTESGRVNGESLLGSPELKRKLREAKAKEASSHRA